MGEHVEPLLAHAPASVGPYRLVARLGAGGMGQVYLATNDHRGLVAVKVVHPGLAHDGQFRGRFRREVAVSRAVTGPYIAAVLDADPDAASPWLATEYVPGPPLDDAVATVGPLGSGPAHVLAHALATALAGIHAVGLVHRDVKPSNVLLGPDRPRLIDFGIARAVDGTNLTSTGAVVGTPAFMSPEQAEGAEVEAASDVFSLGGVVVYALSGRPPFGDGAPFALLLRINDHDPDLDGVPELLRGPVAACLAKAPGDRPTAVELRELFGPPPQQAGAGWLPAPVTALPTPAAPTGPATPAAPTEAVRRPAPAGGHPAAAGVGGHPARAGLASLPPAHLARPPATARRPNPLRRRALLVGAGMAGLTAAVGAGAYLLGRPGPTVDANPDLPAGPRLLWSAAVGGDQQNLALGERMVYAVAGNVLHALDIGTGAVAWILPCSARPNPTGGFDTEAFVAVGDDIVVGTNATLTAVDAVSGLRRWEVPAATVEGALDKSDPWLAADVRIGGGLVYGAFFDTLVALEPATGAQRWSYTPEPDAYLVHVALAGGRVFVCSIGGLAALDAATGRVLWQRADIDTGPVGAGDGMVVVSALTSTTAVDAATGATRWAVPASPQIGERKTYLSGALVYVLGGEAIHALDAMTGATRWAQPDEAVDGRSVFTGPVVDGGHVGACGIGGQLYVLDAATGARRWEYASDQPQGAVRGLALRGGVAYLGRDRPGMVDAVVGT